MKMPATSGVLHALTRTAKWSMDDAHMARSAALSARERSQRALTVAQQQLEASHDYLRQMLLGKVLDATMLQYQHLQNILCQQQVAECEDQHKEREHHADQTQQQLLDAKVRAESYSRLTQRREKVLERDSMRQQQRISDEFGVVRAMTTQAYNQMSNEEN